MKYKYGIDYFGRYAEQEDGERLMVEFYPFWRRHPWRLLAIFSQAYYVLRWHIGMWQQKRREQKEDAK